MTLYPDIYPDIRKLYPDILDIISGSGGRRRGGLETPLRTHTLRPPGGGRNPGGKRNTSGRGVVLPARILGRLAANQHPIRSKAQGTLGYPCIISGYPRHYIRISAILYPDIRILYPDIHLLYPDIYPDIYSNKMLKSVGLSL